MEQLIIFIYGVIIAIFVANIVLAYKMSEVAAMKGYGDEVHAWNIWIYLCAKSSGQSYTGTESTYNRTFGKEYGGRRG